MKSSHLDNVNNRIAKQSVGPSNSGYTSVIPPDSFICKLDLVPQESGNAVLKL